MTGFKGRSGIYEILPMTDELRALMGTGVDLRDLRRSAMRTGVKPLRLAGAAKVALGVTTIEEVLKTAPPMGD